MKFYEDQHKLAAYLERTGAEYQFNGCPFDPIDDSGGWVTKPDLNSATRLVQGGLRIRPVLRYGLPSHLQSEIANPDNLTKEQICEGGKYRACVIGEFLFEGAEFYSVFDKDWSSNVLSKRVAVDAGITYRLPATVPWPDWEREGEVWDEDVKAYVATGLIDSSAQAKDILAAKDACIAELEEEVKFLSDLLETKQKMLEIVANSCGQSTSPWRRMSEVPTEKDADNDGCVPVINEDGNILIWRIDWWETPKLLSHIYAWMPVPKFHGWPDPLTDLLKAHGVEVTPEILAALNAWKGVEK